MNAEHHETVSSLAIRITLSLLAVAGLTVATHRWLTVNATTIGFAYLVLVLLIASTWGFVESVVASIASTLTFNYFFLPPVGAFTVADPQNWVALFSFLTTALVASRLSIAAKERAREAIEHRLDVERLYTFSRAILLIDANDSFPKSLAIKLAEIFHLKAVVLFERRSGEFFRAGPSDFDGLDEQLRESALHGTTLSHPEQFRIVIAVRLGSEPIASLALQGAKMPDSVLQGIANLVAIGLERARAQDLAHQVEAARRSEQLRTTLIDAMAHEFKTPLTSIKAATSSLVSAPDQPLETRVELLRIADEETDRLRGLIDDTIEMARLDTANIEVHLEPASAARMVREVVASMEKEIDSRAIHVSSGGDSVVAVDHRLIKLALKQLIDNALKYSAPGSPVDIAVQRASDMTTIEITDRGKGIPVSEQGRVFERFWRSDATKKLMPGSGLGLSIAHSIARAHNGDLTLVSRPGETTFRLVLPSERKGEKN